LVHFGSTIALLLAQPQSITPGRRIGIPSPISRAVHDNCAFQAIVITDSRGS
jgi:hypothetical protein